MVVHTIASSHTKAGIHIKVGVHTKADTHIKASSDIKLYNQKSFKRLKMGEIALVSPLIHFILPIPVSLVILKGGLSCLIEEVIFFQLLVLLKRSIMCLYEGWLSNSKFPYKGWYYSCLIKKGYKRIQKYL